MTSGLRRSARILGTVLVVTGLAAGAWAIVVWRWQDPFTALYTRHEQHRLAASYRQLAATYRPAAPRATAGRGSARQELAVEGRRFRRTARAGEAIGRIRVPRLDLDMVLVNGTDAASLRKGPGRDRRSFMPGEGQLVYVAGHRTTFLAPFSRIETLTAGDRVTLTMPYGTFVYRITGHRIVRADDLSVLRSRGREQLVLQACHPRFSASHRYLAYARLVRARPRTARRLQGASRGRP